MNFYRTIFFTSTYTIVNFICGFVITKLSAKLIGVEGVALVGQFTNLITFLSLLAVGAIGQGIVKYMADYKDDLPELKRYFTTALAIILTCSCSVTLFVLIFNSWLGFYVFKNKEFNLIFVVYGCFVILNAFNILLSQTLNGLAQIKIMTRNNIIGSVVNLVSTVFLCLNFGEWGMLLAITMGQFAMFIINIISFKQFSWFDSSFLLPHIHKKALTNFLGYSSVIFIDVSVPFIMYLIGSHIIQNLSIKDAGYWQAMNAVSDKTMSLVYTVLGVYYLPKLSSLKKHEEVINEIKWGFIRILPAVGVISFTLWFFRDFIITTLFTEQFLPMRDLFAYWMLGNLFGVSWSLISYFLSAKRLIREIYVLYTFFYGSFFMLNIYLCDSYGLIGTGFAYLTNRVFLFIIILAFFFLIIQKNKRIVTQ